MPTSGMQPVPDPYRVLGVVRGATLAQVKAAHRTLAKRYHPDAADGDTARFLAVQAAYLTLSDPVKRREWDARHEPGPVRAGEGTVRGRPRGASGRWTRENPETGTRRGPRPATRRGPASEAGKTAPPSPGPRRAGAPDGGAPYPGDANGPDGPDGPDGPEDVRRDPGPWSPSGRDPSIHHHTWTAERVPWWEDFPGPRGATPPDPQRRADSSSKPPNPDSASRPPEASPEPPPSGAAGPPTNEFDVYNRSSGAAWSSAARRYFRVADSDLPSRGVFRRQGSEYVTGARARQVADAEVRPDEPTGSPARPRPSGTQAGSVRPTAQPSQAARPPAPPPPPARSPTARSAETAATPFMGTTTRVTRPASPASLPSDLARRAAEVALAWLPLAAAIGWAAPEGVGCDPGGVGCPGNLAPSQAIVAVVLLAIFVAFPRLARVGALATVAALAVAAPIGLVAVLLGLLPPEPPIVVAAGFAIVAAYVVGGAVAALSLRSPRRGRA